MEIKAIQEAIHENAINKGFWEPEPSFGELIALCHSELSEALEEYRNRKTTTEKYCKNFNPTDCDEYFVYNGKCGQNVCTYYKPEGIPYELADCVIRIMDMCEHYGIDLEAAILEKHRYNQTRPFRHGGKTL